MASQNLTCILLASVLVSGCAYHAPDAPTPIDVPPSTAASAIRLVSASRPDRSTDVVATVLTSVGAFVAGARVELATSTGTLSTTSGTTDSAGTVRSVLTNGTTATVRASAAGVSNEITVPGTPDGSITPGTPPTTPTTPTAGPLTVTINASPVGTVGTAVTFGASTQATASALWTFGDGGVSTSIGGTSHAYASAGVFPVGLTVTDVLGRTASTSTTITISPVPPPPPGPAAFAASVNCPKPASGLTVACNVSAFVNGALLPSASVTNVAWDFGDGFIQTTALPVNTRTYASSGTYTVFATVTAATASGSQMATASTSVTTP